MPIDTPGMEVFRAKDSSVTEGPKPKIPIGTDSGILSPTRANIIHEPSPPKPVQEPTPQPTSLTKTENGYGLTPRSMVSVLPDGQTLQAEKVSPGIVRRFANALGLK